jgi:hypothetical protein
LAAEENHVEILQKLWVWAEEMEQNPNALKKKLFLAKDRYGYIAWHQAAYFGRSEALETLWSLAKEAKLNLREPLLAQCEQGRTALHFAAERNRVAILKKLWVCTEEAQQNPNELKKKLLLAKDNHGCTAWQRGKRNCSSQALETLWSLAKEVDLNPNELLLD